MRPLLLLLIIYSLVTDVTAQRTCLSTEYARQFTGTYNPSDGGSVAGRRDTISNEIISIPVVIHVVYNTNLQNISDAQIYSQIEALNNDFSMLNADRSNTPAVFASRAADTKITFCLARVDPNNRLTSGIIRKQTKVEYFLGDDAMKFTAAGGDDAWDNSRYLNIWVCNMFGRSLGYSTMPGAPKDKDGVVINWDVFGTIGTVRSPFDKGRTATHEIGHWLGLKHIWGDDICGTDDVFDTPSQKSYNFYCPSFPKVSNCSPDNHGDMFMNFMDLTDDACMNIFTHGQSIKMRSAFAIEGYRNSFLSSSACDSSFATAGPLPEAAPEIIPNPSPYLEIFPNPLNNYLNLIARNNFQLEGKTCSVFNVQGGKVFEQRMNARKIQLNLSKLSPGVYFLRIGDESGKNMYKLIKL